MKLGNFAREEAVVYNQTRRYLHRTNVTQGKEYRVKYVFSPEPGLPACIYDVWCFDTAEEALNRSVPVPENPVGKSYRYGADTRMFLMSQRVYLFTLQLEIAH